MKMNIISTLFAAALLRGLALERAVSPVQKVVDLLKSMKAQVEKEASEDEDGFNKYQCWCDENLKQKTEATQAAEQRIAELGAAIEAAKGLEAQLTTEISGLEADIAANQESLKQATAVKEKETASFQNEEKDMIAVIAGLKEALQVLSKVQLLQRNKPHAEVKSLLLQVKDTVRGVVPHLGEFRSVMQEDLWDVMSSLEGPSDGATFLPRSSPMSALEQPTGKAAGAKSYNSASGKIYGILGEMKDEFERNLDAARKDEAAAVAAFEQMRAAKRGEIAAATEQKNGKEQQLAATVDQAAKDAEEIEATKNSLSADQRFLVDLTKNCAESKESYAARLKDRTDELQALNEAIGILTTDDARDLFGKQLSFLQTIDVRGAAAADAAQNKRVNAAMKHILRIARKKHDWVLASLAVRVRLDQFTKVKAMMDKMVVDLKAQQKEEDEKKDACNKQIDSNEDDIRSKTNEKEDQQRNQNQLANSIEQLNQGIEELNAEVADLKVNLKKAGDTRSAENKLFQRSISDQRATANILQKALARLKAFYATKSFAQVSAHQHDAAVQQPKKDNAKDYEKSAGASGVLELLAKIITEAARTETQIQADEQSAQKEYEEMVKDANTELDDRVAQITEKTKLMQEASAEKSQVDESLLQNSIALDELGKLSQDIHQSCDWLLKYHGDRATARSEEIQAIVEAKAILSGADFGKAMEEADDAASA